MNNPMSKCTCYGKENQIKNGCQLHDNHPLTIPQHQDDRCKIGVTKVDITPKLVVFNEKELEEVFKLYSYEEIMNNGKQCFVVDVDGLIKTMAYKFGRPALEPLDEEKVARYFEHMYKNGWGKEGPMMPIKTMMTNRANKFCSKFGTRPDVTEEQLHKMWFQNHTEMGPSDASFIKSILSLFRGGND